jgi:hypothetical protein
LAEVSIPVRFQVLSAYREQNSAEYPELQGKARVTDEVVALKGSINFDGVNS